MSYTASLHVVILSVICNCYSTARISHETLSRAVSSLADNATSHSRGGKSGGRPRGNSRRSSKTLRSFNSNRGSAGRDTSDEDAFGSFRGRIRGGRSNNLFDSSRGGRDRRESNLGGSGRRDSADDDLFGIFSRSRGSDHGGNFGEEFNSRAGQRTSARRWEKKFNVPPPSRGRGKVKGRGGKAFSQQKSLRDRNSISGARTTPDYKLKRLTKFVNMREELSIREGLDSNAPLRIHAKVFKLTSRASGGDERIASPFEHVCGGAASKINLDIGNDGPTQYISFSNAERFPQKDYNCKSPFDKGQRRIKVSAETVRADGGLAFDLSSYSSAFYWCYNGGCVNTQKGKRLCFEGAKKIRPWPYACARRAYAIDINSVENEAPPDEWWSFANRKKIADSCATWARRSREVLILPNPDRIFEGYVFNSITVSTDREPSRLQCEHDLTDYCTRWGHTLGVATVMSCNDGLPNTNYEQLLKEFKKKPRKKRFFIF